MTAHESVMVDTDDAHRLLAETKMIHAMEGGSGHYMGTIAGQVSGDRRRGGRTWERKTSFATTDSFVIAHELGHNLGLFHAPLRCTIRLWTAFSPATDGTIGAWGYDFREGGRPCIPGHTGYDVLLSPPSLDQRLPFHERTGLPLARGRSRAIG